MHPFEIVYIDQQERERTYCTYAQDSFEAQKDYNEMVGAHAARLVRIERLDSDFDW